MTKLAVIMTGGKQYVVKPGDILNIERIKDAKEGGKIDFDKVLLTADGDDIKIGAPFISNAKISAKSEGEVRGKKTTALRYKAKTRAKTKKGHRQTYTSIKVVSI